MGRPKFSRKKYDTPSHPWQEDRIKQENELIRKYGLKNKREIWKAQTRLKKCRGQARELLARITSDDEQSKKESTQLLISLNRLNILPHNSTLDDVLALDTESILSRRLQTLTYLKGFANTPKQARQLITHGHIAIGDRRVTVPGYLVVKDEEIEISYTTDSPLNDAMHPARPRADFKKPSGVIGASPTGTDEKTVKKQPSEDKKKPQPQTPVVKPKTDKEPEKKPEEKTTEQKPEEKKTETPEPEKTLEQKTEAKDIATNKPEKTTEQKPDDKPKEEKVDEKQEIKQKDNKEEKTDNKEKTEEDKKSEENKQGGK